MQNALKVQAGQAKLLLRQLVDKNLEFYIQMASPIPTYVYPNRRRRYCRRRHDLRGVWLG
jgi:hypothetical protein